MNSQVYSLIHQLCSSSDSIPGPPAPAHALFCGRGAFLAFGSPSRSEREGSISGGDAPRIASTSAKFECFFASHGSQCKECMYKLVTFSQFVTRRGRARRSRELRCHFQLTAFAAVPRSVACPPPPNNGPNSGRRSEKEKRSPCRMQCKKLGTDTTGSF